MSAERLVHRCRQVLRGELNLELSGRWANELFEMDVPLEDDCQYIVGMLECRMCDERFVAAWALDVADEDAQECRNCEHMTAEPVADDLIEIVVTP